MEKCWDGSPYWSIEVVGYRLFTRNRMGRRGGDALYVREQLECMELCLGVEKEPNENLCVRTRGQLKVTL